ncbi:MAG: ABC transporter ATP-binding protein [Lachnospiraceae bacterium]|nr:ABC transporter ATP-binding protein [Lachnospiraceae bacterium]
MIEVKNLTKKYGDHYAVRDLSFNIEEGLIYGFLGPNGAGKSTTMNMITGYLAPSSGTVVAEGFDIVNEPEKAKALIGYLPEIPPLYPDMTVSEYLTFAAELKGENKKEVNKRVPEVMDKTGITSMKDRLIKNLSKGYKQRVGVSQAILGTPKLIILDEPTVGLDPKQIIEFRELIKELSKEHTILISSHILSEISVVCDRLLILVKGELRAFGTPDEIKESVSKNKVISLKVKGSASSLESILSDMESVESFTEIKSEGDFSSSEITQKEGKDIREELFNRLCKERLPIYELVCHEKTLEDAFIELTGQNREI